MLNKLIFLNSVSLSAERKWCLVYRIIEEVQYYDKQVPEAAARGIYILGATDNVTM